jgi:hypothetical protein
MAHVADYLSLEDLERRYRGCEDACSARHYQTIWPLARGHTVSEVSALTSFAPRWIEELQARYNALGPSSLGDLRRNNGTQPSVLKPELLAKLKVRAKEPPADAGIWTSRKVANWMAAQLGLKKLAPQRGWEALQAISWSIQAPRPSNPKSATAEEAEAYKKHSPKPSSKKPKALGTTAPTPRVPPSARSGYKSLSAGRIPADNRTTGSRS